MAASLLKGTVFSANTDELPFAPPQSAQIYLQRDFINCLKIEDKPGWINVSDFKCNASLHS